MDDRRLARPAGGRRTTRPLAWWQALVGGGACVLVAVLAGIAWEAWRLGWTPEAAAARVERAVRDEMHARITSLDTAVETLTADPRVAAALRQRDRDLATLFALTAEAAEASGVPDVAVTLYDARGEPVAWSGRPSAELGPPALAAAPDLVVERSPVGWRLFDLGPVLIDTSDGTPVRLGTVVAERSLSPPDWTHDPSALAFPLQTRLAPVSMTLPRFAATSGAGGRDALIIRRPRGDALLLADTSPAEVARLRAEGRSRVRAVALAILALTSLLIAAVWGVGRRTAASPGHYLRLTLGAVAALAAARLLFWAAVVPSAGGLTPLAPELYTSAWLGGLHRTPLDLFISGGILAGLLTLLVDPTRRAMVIGRSVRRAPLSTPGALAVFVLWQLGAGLAAALLAWTLARLVQDTIRSSPIDLLNLSLWPWDGARLVLVFGLVFFATAALWLGVLALRLALAPWRVSRRQGGLRVLLPVLWLLPGLVLLATLGRGDIPALAFVLMLAAAAAGAWGTARGIAWYRHGSPTTRLVALLSVVLLPALLVYPALFHEGDRERRRLIETEYAPQATALPAELQTRLHDSLRQIDEMDGLDDLVARVTAVSNRQQPSTDEAFTVWRETDLARLRLTSSIEIHAATPNGELHSRFAFNLPEHVWMVPPFDRRDCSDEWEIYGEVSRFGAEERSLLHAERAICQPTPGGPPRMVGGISVHAMFDYAALPFLFPQNPYAGLFRGAGAPNGDERPLDQVDLVVYGWGRTPIYTSARRPWPLSEETFGQAFRSREPFWAQLPSGDGRHNVYVTNNRLGIYMVGHPRVGAFGHLVRLAEIATLAGVLYLFVLAASFVIAWVGREAQPARALVREVRTTFARKLFLAFVAAAVIPVLILALLVRAYVVTELRGDVEEEAARTALIARRVIEEAVAAQQEARREDFILSDDEMLGISRVIEQDVSIFEDHALVATSLRDLYASGLLPTRTPDAVYRAIVLEQLSNVVTEDQSGTLPYRLAAAPVALPGRRAILTVPLASREQEIERAIDELDRGIHLGAILFILFGAGIGYSMAHRIADPVQRLTRASRRVAAGDFDARVVARTADELRRLVEAFNSMAADLARQRDQLARTERLEAWAQMARQVAHDIKNPLTPIQLAAEHLLRVHRDRGQPLSPVLEGCLEAILSQVRVLRQIAAEFASFAASPTARLEPTPLGAVIDEVVDPYRAGLTARVQLDVGVAPDLPPLLLDRVLLGRAMINIMENAIHAMPGGGTLSVRAVRDGRAVHVAFADTGVGMDPDALARVFEPYFSNKAAGTGLGLSIARRNVELQGGSITIDSRKGEGTTVTLVLPVAGPPQDRPDYPLC